MRAAGAVALAACAACGTGHVQAVDRVEGTKAVLVDAAGGEERVDAAGLAEGDVLLNGEADPAQRARLAAEVAARRARLSARDDGADLWLDNGSGR
jgi:hypothetical protein